ncbi:MAG: AmmeMemoRadiSam system protein B [Bacteroidales bacterium]
MFKSTRKPAVAGLFYPENREDLTLLIKQIDNSVNKNSNTNLWDNQIIGGVLPHAGYIYSAHHAIPFFHAVSNSAQDIDTVIILNPNHQGIGPDVALDNHDNWETPLGIAALDKDFYKILNLPVSAEAHQEEHSAEVMIPLIQYYLGENIRILPISIKNQTYDTAKQLGKNLGNATNKLDKRVLIIASSDFSHFESPSEGYRLDSMVLEKILKMDAKGVYQTITNNGISVCGYGPIMALMEYAKLQYANYQLNILSRGHSGDVSPSSTVVDYISIIFQCRNK